MFLIEFEDKKSNNLGTIISSLIPAKGCKVFLYNYNDFEDPLVGTVEEVNYFYHLNQYPDLKAPTVIIDLIDIQYPDR